FLAMGCVNVEAVAHPAEDILSVVRDGSATLDDALATVLFRAVDPLKDMRGWGVAQRGDAPEATDLPAAPGQHRSPPTAPVSETAAPSSAPLGDDPELMAIYSELLEQRLPLLAGILSGQAGDRADATEAAGDLANGAEMMGFESLAHHLN